VGRQTTAVFGSVHQHPVPTGRRLLSTIALFTRKLSLIEDRGQTDHIRVGVWGLRVLVAVRVWVGVGFGVGVRVEVEIGVGLGLG